MLTIANSIDQDQAKQNYSPVSGSKLVVTCDLEQCDILTSVDLDEPVQSPFKIRNSK